MYYESEVALPTREEAIITMVDSIRDYLARGGEASADPEYPPEDTLLTLEAALAVLPESERAIGADGETNDVLVIDAIDKTGVDLGDVIVERMGDGFVVSTVAVTHNTSGKNIRCE
ncbi:hypothetical protein ROT00_07860 [Agromyces mediolanus]|uniref:hypothetical protein n=1 Tax=Agromyces mediolanus TaxID=41986 RepID=UPI0038379425